MLVSNHSFVSCEAHAGPKTTGPYTVLHDGCVVRYTQLCFLQIFLTLQPFVNISNQAAFLSDF